MSWENHGSNESDEQFQNYGTVPQGYYMDQSNGNQVNYAGYYFQRPPVWFPQQFTRYPQAPQPYILQNHSFNGGMNYMNPEEAQRHREGRYRQPPGVPTPRFPQVRYPGSLNHYNPQAQSSESIPAPQDSRPGSSARPIDSKSHEDERESDKTEPSDSLPGPSNVAQQFNEITLSDSRHSDQPESDPRRKPNSRGVSETNGGVPRHQKQNENRVTGRWNGQNRRQTSGNGSARPYRNPNAYYGTTQYPHSSQDDRGGDRPECSKTQGRKTFLAEVATLLNQDKSQPKAANTTAKGGSKDRDRGWAAVPNQQVYKRSTKREAKATESKSKREPETQRERLIDQLTSGTLECLVCCERLWQWSPVWSCENCFHVLHLSCVSKWALTSTTKVEGVRTRVGTNWRCPACQFTYDFIPDKYTCFCSKLNQPKWVKGETPHCCGETCGKARKACPHLCTLACHPGPCPPCAATVVRECGCGRSKQSVLCGSAHRITCDAICSKRLACGNHDCEETCHPPPCSPCSVSLTIQCHCGSESKDVDCGWEGDVSCGKVCGKSLECGNHSCLKLCHSGPCGPCPYDPLKYTTCHCGAKEMIRESCSQEVESCGGVCNKLRAVCTHRCPQVCHPGNCSPCDVTVTSPCRCGHAASLETTCYKLQTLGERPVCKKKCSKKRSCAKHRCNQECCSDSVHTCPLPCNKTLSCGQHRCELLCHLGNCLPCTRLGFDELRCECGTSVIYPPVECGTRAPECSQPCTREHTCDHPPTHTCHSQAACPPCTVLVSRTCFGGHETRKAVACYIAEYSCGLACSKPLPCNHRCVERCHGGPCPTTCRQPCPTPRPLCSHPCALSCHVGSPCSPSPCSTPLEVSCSCGRRVQTLPCWEFRKTWGRAQAAQAAASQAGRESVVVDSTKINTKVLDCDDECKLQERNMRLAIGLQIANPDLSNKLKPAYSESMRQWAKRDPHFCGMVHSRLTNLVQLAKESKQKSRSYSFEVMGSAKRQFVHEYCRHFGCESVAYDAEPKRNVVATAYRDRCWLPSYSLLEVIQRESGLRKVPVPSIRKLPTSSVGSSGSSTTGPLVQLPLSKPQASQPERSQSPNIDYFDFTPAS